MSNAQPLSAIQRRRLVAFIYASPAITLPQLLAKWQISQELVAELCHCNVRTVRRWLSQGRYHEFPTSSHKWDLALADVILSSFDELPVALKDLLCPGWEQ
jgi:hypothetical protein